jgi:hypothetical protein
MGGGSARNMYSITGINKLRKVTSCWLYLRNITEDARTYECQICCVCLLLFLLLSVIHVNHCFKSKSSCEILHKLKCAHDHNHFQRVFKGTGCLYGSIRQIKVCCLQTTVSLFLKTRSSVECKNVYLPPTAQMLSNFLLWAMSTCFKRLQRKHLILTVTWFMDIKQKIIILQTILCKVAAWRYVMQ